MSKIILDLVIVVVASSVTCGNVKELYTSNECCGADTEKSFSPTCSYDSPLNQMREFVGDWGQCVDGGLVWHTQNWNKTSPFTPVWSPFVGLTKRPEFSMIFPYKHLTDARLKTFCKGMAPDAEVRIQSTGQDGIEYLGFGYEPKYNLSLEVNRLYSTTITDSETLPVISTVLGIPGLTQADIGIDTAYDNYGMKFTKWYSAMWYAFGYSAISHMFVPFGAEFALGGIDNEVDEGDDDKYDGVIEARGYCLHFSPARDARMGPFGGVEPYQANVFLNYRFYFKMINGRMLVARYYHIKYMEERVPVPPNPAGF